jgi:hypothetical protein
VHDKSRAGIAIIEGQQRRIVGGVDIGKDRRVAAVVDDQDGLVRQNRDRCTTTVCVWRDRNSK